MALALEAACPGIEANVDPLDIESSVASAARLGALATSHLPVRYHFPLHGLELSVPDRHVADEALVAMKQAVAAIAAAGGDYLTVHAALPSHARHTEIFAATAARLTDLVAEGRDHGVTVALENLKWGLTSEPDTFLGLVCTTGAAVTIDVGHAVSSDMCARGYSAERFIADCGPLVGSAHVYGHETDRHHPPTDLDRIGGALHALCDAGCPWWTIELTDADDVRATRRLLSAFLDSRFAAPDAACA